MLRILRKIGYLFLLAGSFFPVLFLVLSMFILRRKPIFPEDETLDADGFLNYIGKHK